VEGEELVSGVMLVVGVLAPFVAMAGVLGIMADRKDWVGWAMLAAGVGIFCFGAASLSW
jgi:hypothetical protein